MNAEDFISWNTDSSEFLSWHNIYAMQSCVFSKNVYSGVSHKEASTAFMEIIATMVSPGSTRLLWGPELDAGYWATQHCTLDVWHGTSLTTLSIL